MKVKQRISQANPRVPQWLIYSCLFIAGIGLALVAMQLWKPPQDLLQSAPVEPNAGLETRAAQSTVSSQDQEFRFSDNWYMNTRALFVLDGVWHRMGNIGEILDTVKRIRHTSELSWFREWNRTAARVEAVGDDCLAKNHRISAGEAYLRAANYYLAAEVFLHTNPDDPRILTTYQKGTALFLTGLKLLEIPVREVRIPYQGTTLRGYFFRSPVASGKAPTLIVHQGFDAPVEATKYIADEAVRRGYHCLLFEGPGQGLIIREQKLPFRPDWEKVVTPVVDYLVARPEVDPSRLILMGISMGGGFAVRAAAFEHRLKACIVNPGYLNLYGMLKDMLTPALVNLYEQDPEEFNKKFLELTQYDVGIRWGLHHGMWVFGGSSPSDFLTRLKSYDYNGLLPQIRCPMLVMDGTRESWGKGQAKRLYDALNCPKDYMLFTEDDSAALHCQSGAPALSTQRMFDWLDENVR
jgi:alpha-beta hydrolase superfamily lysophospholipase